MSLKAFHVFFIAVCTIFSVGFGVWCFARYGADGGFGYLATGVASVAGGGALVFYGVFFLRKFKDIGYL
jgi:hypothetical protein